jgi:hypothetical protein
MAMEYAAARACPMSLEGIQGTLPQKFANPGGGSPGSSDRQARAVEVLHLVEWMRAQGVQAPPDLLRAYDEAWHCLPMSAI